MSQSAFYDLAVIDNVPFGLTGSQGRFFCPAPRTARLEELGAGTIRHAPSSGWALDMPWPVRSPSAG